MIEKITISKIRGGVHEADIFGRQMRKRRNRFFQLLDDSHELILLGVLDAEGIEKVKDNYDKLWHIVNGDNYTITSEDLEDRRMDVVDDFVYPPSKISGPMPKWPKRS